MMKGTLVKIEMAIVLLIILGIIVFGEDIMAAINTAISNAVESQVESMIDQLIR